ncbi:MAG TPA: ubiquinone biosynthesis regulatory protein kinase UbiB [Usitatibacter sp.]|jgi:ubiquinone biosynthesis protein|nr:ubiquinone biosynthesis regulatory protein kinase UbiB [Usitatibacter sp.]
MRVLRFLRIVHTIGRYRLDEFAPARGAAWLRALLSVLYSGADRSVPRAVRLRLALESLGPIFVKFGQLLSVRPDLVPEDLALELARLQDNVPPFPWEAVAATLDRAYGMPHATRFASIETVPIASASVAQVHFAVLPDGREAAVKVLRPGIARVIDHDVALLRALAGLLERVLPEGRRLRPREVVAEFEKTIVDELDLLREAANASQLRRNFADGRLLIVPEVYWDWCAREVMVMQRIHGTPVNAVQRLRDAGIDIAKLARDGVEIFFTQVFRDGFFHADMHPGNIFVAPDGRYCGVDFGIMGTLSPEDKDYLAVNFMAFFRRDYRRVALAHIEAGWVPPETRADEFEGAIRSVCEPIFDRPLKDIYFGKLLLRLFEVSSRFRMEIQPQLALLQKTLLQVEGLGRQLDPDLDVRRAAQPILERWIHEQVGWRALVRSLREEAPFWARTLPQLPRLVHRSLARDDAKRIEAALDRLQAAQRREARILGWMAVLLAVLVVAYLLGG